ncbi:spore germination protein [Paenibacillus radicis (ex Xue et al. 2023)]|uniref:Spore germination protein n=1 Tax=Paenibacillus radicis (ex Xue et al. 2023) TaxID=2972489 RepID=A0ABT1YDZ4_9BACL|nr:spore germination protein [Paenibacillus radicis (ex Xue et al. 2023)]MCR8631403.1 spore germination protein [Paenibacillus radicis (ex Xue et al. 2023)]
MVEHDDGDKSLNLKLADNLKQIRKGLGYSDDVTVRDIVLNVGNNRSVQGAVFYVEGISNLHNMVHSLLASFEGDETNNFTSEQLLDHCKKSVVSSGSVADIFTFDELYGFLLSGDSIVLVDECSHGLAVSTKELVARTVEEPNVQSVVRGPREGFTEVLRWNTAMLRRKIKDRHLWMETMSIGTVTKTEVAVVYIQNIVSEDVLKEVKQRLSTIDIDAVLESNYIEEQIEDKGFTPFPTIFNSERPDVVAAGLLEGRVAIMVDGTPFVLLVPALFTQFFQSSEDYYQRADFATLIRLLRFLSFGLALLTPSFYIAISTFHQEMLPTTLLYNLASQREGVPFPAFIEAILMEVTFEILREASVRMPRTVGQSISIVGTLVVGQAAVEAGLVSAAMVIVVSITAISNFVLPAFNLGITIRIIRFVLMILAATFGLFGIFMGLIAIVVHMCGLHSFGVPYMSSLAPFHLSDQKDTLFRFSFPNIITRPKMFRQKNLVRQKRR